MILKLKADISIDFNTAIRARTSEADTEKKSSSKRLSYKGLKTDCF
jgi:hypothetical protein